MVINLGDEVKDKITGFKGIAVARTVYLNGCIQYNIVPKGLKDGLPIDDVWIDEAQLVLVKSNGKKEASPRHGGIRSHPKR